MKQKFTYQIVVFSVLLALILSAIGVTPAQASTADYVWAKGMGGTSNDAGESIAVDDSGNVYTTGTFYGTADFDPGAGTANLTSAGGADIFVSKLDASGNFVWAKRMGGPSIDGALDIALDGSGNVYTTGDFQGNVDFDPGAGTANLTSVGGLDIFVSKLDASGNFVWARQMGGTSYDLGRDIAVDGSGNVYTTGTFYGTADFNPGADTASLTSAGPSDIFISKLNASGSFVWAGQISGASDESVYGIALDGSGSVYTTGYFMDTADFDPGAGTASLTSAGIYDIFVSKLDASGNFVWVRQMGGMSDDGALDIALDGSGNVYTTGPLTDTADFDPGAGTANLTSAGARDIFVSKLDASGNFVWAKQMGGKSDDNGKGIAVDGSGSVYTTGYFMDTADFDPGAGTASLTSAGSWDIFVSKLDASGSFVWARQMGGASIDGGKDIAVDGSGNVYTTGTFYDTADFDPSAGTANLTSAGGADIFVSKLDVTVTQATPVITWADPANIVYGTPLSGAQLNATTDTPGAFTYSPVSGTILDAGPHTLHVEFVPTDTANYTNASKDVSVTVTQATPVITWADPANIVYGTPLSGAQLNATTDTPGVFTYSPVSGTVLDAGPHTLHVEFVPTDTTNFTNASKDVSITVTQATPVITWADPANIVYGTPLSGAQLNATTDTPGTFTYSPVSGTVLDAGPHTLHVEFVPTDTTNFTNASKDVSITVTQATPVITWADPANIVYGTPLSDTQLNAAANTSGAFTYTPASGAVLAVGTHTLHVEFVPTDTTNFINASKDVSVTVTQATPAITWADPANIVYGTPLSGAQLNATTDTPGVFTYSPVSGTILDAGPHTLHVEFVPTDTANYTNASKDVSITVTQATPVITWADPANIVYGTPLSGAQLNATTDTPGVFTYSPVSGTVLDAGPHTLHVEFVPTDTTNFTNASKDVSITVTQATPVLTWADPANIDQGTPLSDTQLNASTDVPGDFTYTPAAGTLLSTGTHTLHVDFVPTDALNYANASKEVSLTVNDHVIFSDVSSDYWARLHIERLYLNQVTGGCANNPLQYCPTTNVNRAMMAVFVLRAAHGPDFTPPPATGTVFADVPADSFAAAWIEQLAAEGITSGCGGGNYCPNGPVTRAVMAVFIVRAKYGIDYTPPDATGEIFDDVPANGFAAAFIEKLAADGVTSGCGGGNYCPANFITRAEMAVFLVAAFNLP